MNKSASVSRIASTRNAVHSKTSLNPNAELRNVTRLNSNVLCLQVAKRWMNVMKEDSQKKIFFATLREDFPDDGLNVIATPTAEFTQENGNYFTT